MFLKVAAWAIPILHRIGAFPMRSQTKPAQLAAKQAAQQACSTARRVTPAVYSERLDQRRPPMRVSTMGVVPSAVVASVAGGW